ncbi:hypothetical protein JTB14_009875 [Gonioctena quinquepunctata]|nr:hypothetical protein JTB14_009875 [Gonioctena quinquepunctata]
MAQLVTDIQVSSVENGYLGAAFLDIKGAFDSVDLHMLRDTFLNAGFPTSLVNVICKIYRDRNVHLRSMNNTLIGQKQILGQETLLLTCSAFRDNHNLLDNPYKPHSHHSSDIFNDIRPVEIIIPVYSYFTTISKHTLSYHMAKFPNHLQV